MREVPPTAGLPLEAGDLWPCAGPSLETGLAGFLDVPAVQITCSGTAAQIVTLLLLAKADLQLTCSEAAQIGRAHV